MQGKSLFSKLGARYVGLVVSSVLIGLLSGFFFPGTMGVRAALLAVAISLGIIGINAASRKQLASRTAPKWSTILVVAAIFGCLGGLAVNAFGLGGKSIEGELPPVITAEGVPTVLVGLFFSVVLHVAYALRWRFRSKRVFLSFVLISLAGGFCTILRAFVDPSLPIGAQALVMSVFTGVPFAALWAVVAMLLDPAWSFNRWAKCQPSP